MLADGEIVRLDRGRRARPAGRVRRLGGHARDRDRGRWCGCCPRPQRVETLLAAFASTDAAGEAVSAVIAAGIVPAAIEMMDALTIHAAEARVHAGLPLDAGAVLLVELDGPAVEVEADLGRVRECARRPAPARCASPTTRTERAGFWRGRKAAFAAMGRMSPDYYVQDGVVPRTRLPRDAAPDPRALAAARPARRQRVPRGRRQPASARALRRRGRGRGRAGRGARGADPGRLRRRRRVAHGRARRSASTRRAHAADVLRGRPGDDAAPALRLRPGRAVQPRQGVPDAAAVRRGARPLPPAPARAGGGRSGGDRARAGRSDLHRRRRRRAARGARAGARPAAARCSRSTRRAPSG